MKTLNQPRNPREIISVPVNTIFLDIFLICDLISGKAKKKTKNISEQSIIVSPWKDILFFSDGVN